jgi:hypothetical protein
MDSETPRLYFDRKAVDDVCAALPLYSAKEFQSPTRSTVPLLSLVKHGDEVLKSLLRDTGMNAASRLHLEFTVAPPRGTGVASHTDLMARWQGDTLAIEAKWTEPRYLMVSEWIKEGSNTENRHEVLRGWLDLLQPHATRELHLETFTDAVYQMVHRAASACYQAEKPNAAYMHFTPDPSGAGATSAQYKSDLERLYSLLGNPPGFGFFLIEIQSLPTAAFERIASLPKGTTKTAVAVQKALTEGGLFDFNGIQVQRIGKAL